MLFALPLAVSPGHQMSLLDSLAIVGATVETSPGQVMQNATILVSKGKIVSVGAGTAVPAGYETVGGKGLFVYPGFIDAGVSKGMKDATGAPRQDEPFDTTANVATSMAFPSPLVMCSVRAANSYDPDDGFWGGERSAGFTSAVLLPGKGILQGEASLVNLSGRPRKFSCVSPALGMKMAFNGGGGAVYPGTPLGAFATARQAFEDASWINGQRHNATGPRPPDDPDLQALSDWKASGRPALLEADEDWKIEACLRFAKEYKLTPIIVGGSQSAIIGGAMPVSPVIAHIAFPPEPKDDAPLPANVKAEKKRLWLRTVTTAQKLTAAGDMVALSTDGCKDQATFFENLRRTIKEGWARNDALAALTLNPAKMLGLDSWLGTIEPGKTANLTILTADFTDAKAKVKYIVTDGIKIDPSKAPFKFSNAPQQNFGDIN